MNHSYTHSAHSTFAVSNRMTAACRAQVFFAGVAFAALVFVCAFLYVGLLPMWRIAAAVYLICGIYCICGTKTAGLALDIC